MNGPSREAFPDDPLLGCIRDKFADAWSHYIENDNIIDIQMGLGGRVEVIALNPKTPGQSGDNVRFVLSRGTLAFNGLRMEADGQEFNVEHTIVKIILGPDDTRSITELETEDLKLMTLLMVHNHGEVSSRAGWLTSEEKQELETSIANCEISPFVPSWARDNME